MKRAKSKDWVSPRHKAVKNFYAYMKAAGINLDWETAAKLYVDVQKEFPRFRAKEIPARGTFDRLEVIASDEHGAKWTMEAAKPEWAQRRKAKRQWRELFSQRTRQGLFTFVKHKRKALYGMGFRGGTHRAFLLFTDRMEPVIREILGELQRESRKDSMKKHSTSI